MESVLLELAGAMQVAPWAIHTRLVLVLNVAVQLYPLAVKVQVGDVVVAIAEKDKDNAAKATKGLRFLKFIVYSLFNVEYSL